MGHDDFVWSMIIFLIQVVMNGGCSQFSSIFSTVHTHLKPCQNQKKKIYDDCVDEEKRVEEIAGDAGCHREIAGGFAFFHHSLPLLWYIVLEGFGNLKCKESTLINGFFSNLFRLANSATIFFSQEDSQKDCKAKLEALKPRAGGGRGM
jgi:hypothetical protein